MDVPQEDSVEAWLYSGKLALKFGWRQDRFFHTVHYLQDGNWQAWLESVEGGASASSTNEEEESWPTSPPFQYLSFETQELPQETATGEKKSEPKKIALLVGMAGVSHWSASIVPVVGGFAFDVACRVKEEPQLLKSTYRMLLPSGRVIAESSQKAECIARGRDSLQMSLVGAKELPATLTVKDGVTSTLEVEPAIPEKLELPITIRWRYSIQLSKG
ncbi:Hypothetical protein PBC10988_15310 [Planctomycetales bacterium 10988]|nr:Hypothetical protein PBC10988_15310 [Planctomycetales bacterium 10988]